LQKSVQEESRALRSASVLIVGGAPEFRSHLRESLRKHVALVDSAESAAKAGQLMARCRFGYLIVNSELPDMARRPGSPSCSATTWWRACCWWRSGARAPGCHRR